MRHVNLKKINIDACMKCQTCPQIHQLGSKYVKWSSQITVGRKSAKLVVNVSSKTTHIYTVEEIHRLPSFLLIEYG